MGHGFLYMTALIFLFDINYDFVVTTFLWEIVFLLFSLCPWLDSFCFSLHPPFSNICFSNCMTCTHHSLHSLPNWQQDCKKTVASSVGFLCLHIHYQFVLTKVLCLLSLLGHGQDIAWCHGKWWLWRWVSQGWSLTLCLTSCVALKNYLDYLGFSFLILIFLLCIYF